MSEITKCLNEWNATIEALGQGKQTILIRKYNTTLNEFLLYPTVSYAKKDDFLDSFQEDEKGILSINIAELEKKILAQISPENGYSMYIDIPFCPTTCMYCSFTSNPIG